MENIFSITPEQRQTIVAKLMQEGFKIGKLGHVDVSKVEEGHPRPGQKYGLHMHPLPVGFVGSNYAFLVNTDEPFLEIYHGRIKNVYESAGATPDHTRRPDFD